MFFKFTFGFSLFLFDFKTLNWKLRNLKKITEFLEFIVFN